MSLSSSSAAGPSTPVSRTAAAATTRREGSGGSVNPGRQLGTLVVVVLKAKNLPNKQKIGKQDPYCSCSVGHQKHRTPAVKRGGQTPFWDAQLQFEIWEDTDNAVKAVTTDSGGIAPAPLTPTSGDTNPSVATVGRPAGTGKGGTEGKRILKLACYADDPREPDLIGETSIDFTNTLKKGEFDEWVEIKYKGKYAGEVFLEMTFYASGPPPARRAKKPVDLTSGYGGPGTFEPLPSSFPQGSPQTADKRNQRLSSGGPSSQLQPLTMPSPSPSPAPSISSSSLQSSQYGHSLRPSTSSMSNASGLNEFGARQSSIGFPQAPVKQNTYTEGDRYTPPYAPPSLHQSTSSNNLGGRPHRYSSSSYGLTQHDIDSLSRPFSSMSVNSNKPLPLPSSIPGDAAEVGLHRPPSAQPPAPAQQYTGGMPQHPSLEHHAHSMPLPPPGQQAFQPHQQDVPHPNIPHNPHRHSLSTYVPQVAEPAYSNWNGGQIPVHPGGEDYSQPQQLGDAFRPASSASWNDPRIPSPSTPSFPSYNNMPQASTSPRPEPSSPHPTSLLAGRLNPASPRAQQSFAITPPTAHQPLFADGRVSPSVNPPYNDQYAQQQQPVQDWRTPSPQHQATFAQQQQYQPPVQQSPWDQASQAVHSQPHDAYGGVVDYIQAPPEQLYHQNNVSQQYQQDYNQPQQDYHPPPQQDYQQHQVYDQQQYQQPPQHYQQSAPEPYYPPPQQHYQEPQYDGPRPPLAPPAHVQSDYRTASPYRPLPSTPDPWQHPQSPYQPSTTPQPPPPPPLNGSVGSYQPRFGLPPHQPYDQPYQQHAPPPVPPVPAELRRDQNGGWY